MNIDYINLPALENTHGKEIKIAYPKISYRKYSGRKIMLVSDTTTKEDIESGRLFDSPTGQTICNTFEEAIKTEGKPKELLIVSTFVIKKFNSLSQKEQAEDLEAVTYRLARLINAYKPDCIVLLGVRHLEAWRKHIKFSGNFSYHTLKQLRGRVLPVTIGKHNCNVIVSFSPRSVASQDYKHFGTTVNLLGFVLRDFENAIRNKNLYTLPKIDKSKCYNITTIKEFDKFYEKLLRAKTPSIDTECDNLHRVHENRLLVMLFSLDGEHAYQIPFMHPQSPFTPKELNYIAGKMRYYFEFCSKHSYFHIYHTAKFDILIFFAQIGVRYYDPKVWDIVSGEYFLDENRKFFKNEGFQKPYTLETLTIEYGSLAYSEGKLGKEDRKNLADQSLEDILEYGAKDVIFPYHIVRFQMAEAKRRGKLYKNYANTVLELGGDAMTLVFVDMEHNGTLVDRKYLANLMSPTSAISQEREKRRLAFKDFDAAKAVNSLLLKKRGVPTSAKGIFNKNDMWVFDPNKDFDKQELFYKQLGLHALAKRKDGGGKIDKAFINEYKSTVPEVQALFDFREVNTLINTFIGGLFKALANTPDSYVDSRLRAAYNFFTILTVRTSASSPNLQNIPTRGKLAKIIKRMFIASRGKIIVKLDYSANEVRVWGNVSNDITIGRAFAAGMMLRREIRILRGRDPQLDYDLEEWFIENEWFEKNKDGTPKSLKDKKALASKLSNRPDMQAVVQLMIKNDGEGDVHKKNYEFFFGVKAALVNDAQRYSVKAVVFGVMYGKMFRALANDVWKKEIQPILQKYAKKLREAGENEEGINAAQEWYNEHMEPFWTKSKDLIDKLFSRFHKGGDWIKKIQYEGKENLRVVSPFGAVRHLWGYLHNDRAVHGMMDRRGPNCVDEQTECLTEKGWKNYKELKVGDRIYTKNIKTGKLELQPIQYLTVAEYKGKMWRLNGAIDALVTPNHRWLVDYDKGQYERPELVESAYIANSASNNAIHLTADFPISQSSKGKWSSDEIKLIGWVVTDGHYVKDREAIGLCQSYRGNPEKVKIIDKIFSRLNIKRSRSKDKSSNAIRWKFYGSTVDKIKSVLPNKVITPEFLKELTTRQLGLLYEHMLLGNGAYISKLKYYDSFGAGTKEKAEAFSMLCVLLGVSHKITAIPPRVATKKYESMPNIPKQTKDFWVVEFKQRNRAQAMFYNSWVDYKGKVWCPTVNNGTFIAKRNGTVYVTGNSLVQGPASNLGYFGARIMRKFTWKIQQLGIDLGWIITNYVHDAIESEAYIASLPVTLYFMEHAVTTGAHKHSRKIFGFPLNIGLEVEFDIGGAMSRVTGFDFTESSLVSILNAEIDWMNEELKYGLDKKQLMKDVVHNWRIINAYRCKELAKIERCQASEEMLITPEMLPKLGLRGIKYEEFVK